MFASHYSHQNRAWENESKKKSLNRAEKEKKIRSSQHDSPLSRGMGGGEEQPAESNGWRQPVGTSRRKLGFVWEEESDDREKRKNAVIEQLEQKEGNFI